MNMNLNNHITANTEYEEQATAKTTITDASERQLWMKISREYTLLVDFFKLRKGLQEMCLFENRSVNRGQPC